MFQQEVTNYSSQQNQKDLLSQPASAARAIAELSVEFSPLMAKNKISATFTKPLKGAPWIVDATQNPSQAYKVRGALASILRAVADDYTSVWTASAGNHGAGVAYASKLLGVEAVVYVPFTAPKVKVRLIESFGARVEQRGRDFTECLRIAREERAVPYSSSAFIHPFDDLVVAAGQGTLGVELVDHVKRNLAFMANDLANIFLPIGGGGLIAGVTSVLRNHWPREAPSPRIIGVVDEGVPASVMGTLFGRPIETLADTVADGTRVMKVGETFLAVAPLIDNIMVVPHDTIVTTMRYYKERMGLVLEASGALAITGERLARKYGLFPESSVTEASYALVTGRNVDGDTFDDLTVHAQRRCLRGHSRLAVDVEIPERDGELLRFLSVVESYNIVSLTYRQLDNSEVGRLRVEFELPAQRKSTLMSSIGEAFPGSQQLPPGHQTLLPVSTPSIRSFRERLITPEDSPGAFKRCIAELNSSGELGSVGFLYYRQPSGIGSRPQVLIGTDTTKHTLPRLK